MDDLYVRRQIWRRRLPRPDQKIQPSLALIRPRHAEVGERALPEIHGRPGDRAGGHLQHHGAGFGQIHESDDVRRGDVRREEPADVTVSLVNDHVPVLCAEFIPLLTEDILEPDGRQRPKISLAGTLEIHAVEQPLRAVLARDAQLEFDRAHTGLHRLGVDGWSNANGQAHGGREAGDED